MARIMWTKWFFPMALLGSCILFIVQRNFTSTRTNFHLDVSECSVSHVFRDRILNKVVTDYDVEMLQRLQKMVNEKVLSRDPELISFTKELMDAPHVNVTSKIASAKGHKTPQSIAVDRLFNKMKNRFFVECGALNGVHASNTLFLETQRNWTGLLIEMDPFFYTQLLGTARQAWSINACVSPRPHPTLLQFRESGGQLGQLVDPEDKRGPLEPELYKSRSLRATPCLPLESMLIAINTTVVDYFSLDVEGFEMDILRTIPFERLDIKVLSIEYQHGHYTKEEMRTFMEEKGYYVHQDIIEENKKSGIYVYDYIFVKDDLNY